MNVHKNARLTPYRRAELVQRAGCGEPVPELARQLGVSLRTTRKWLARYRTEGVSGLNDRSSRPHASPRATAPAIALGMKVLRLQRWTCGQIAGAVGVSAATAARLLRHSHLSRLAAPASPYASVHTAHQRQSRAVHPNGATRVGLRPPLLQLRRTWAASTRLDRALQLRPTTWQSRRQAAHESVPGREQPHA